MAEWSEPQVEQLKSLWKEGLSCSQISGLIPGFSRNAVIGKIHRLGLAVGVRTALPKRARRTGNPVSSIPRDRRFEGNGQRKGTRTKVEDIAAVPAARPVLPPVEAVSDPIDLPQPTGRVKLADLNGNHCRWPLGDPRASDFGFCGCWKPLEVPYCEPHRLKARAPSLQARAA